MTDPCASTTYCHTSSNKPSTLAGRSSCQPAAPSITVRTCRSAWTRFYETSLILAAHPELVDQTKLDVAAPWYTHAATSSALDASVEAGERLWNTMVDAWIEKLAVLE